MTLTICMKCGESWDNENVYGFRFCDECFEELGDSIDGAENYYNQLHPEWKLWWDKFEEEEMN